MIVTRLRVSLAWNTVSQIIGKIITSGVSVLVTILLARRFGIVGYGDFVKITTYVSLFYLLSDFGFNAIAIQKARLDGNTSHKTVWSTLFTLRILWALALMVLCLLGLVFLPQGASQGYTTFVRFAIVLFIPTILFQAMITTGNAIFQNKLRYDLATLALLIGGLVTLGGVWLISGGPLSGLGLIGVILVTSLGTLVSAVFAVVLAKKLAPEVGFFFASKQLVSLLYAALPLGITLLLNLVYFRIDSIIMTLTRTTAEVGIYGFAYKVFEFPLVIPTFFMNALYPVLVGKLGSEHAQKQLLTKASLLLGATSLVVVIIGWFLAPWVTYVRPDFAPSIVPLRILILGLPFFYLSSLTMWTLVARKKQGTLLFVYGIGAVVNIALNIWLTPKFGYIAASWITVGSEALVLVISVLALVSSRNVYTKEQS